MNSVLQLLVLAGIAIFLIVRLKNVLGTRDGFEKPPTPLPRNEPSSGASRREFDVIEGGADTEITSYVPDGSPSAKALAQMKMAEPSFSVSEFLEGAKGAYEMILMAFENGEIDEIAPFLSEEVRDTFVDVVGDREDRGLSIEASFVGLRELDLESAEYDRDSKTGEITVRFVGELTSVVRDSDGEIVEGNPNEIKRQRDVWTFARKMGSSDPNWQLVATGG